MSSSENPLDFIIHLSSPEVVGTVEYLELIEQFNLNHKNAEHVYMHPDFVTDELMKVEQNDLFEDIATNFYFSNVNGKNYKNWIKMKLKK
jgi:hypothetical protein